MSTERKRPHYWAIRPGSWPFEESLNVCRIERAIHARAAARMAFGSGRLSGDWLIKDLGTRVSLIQSNPKRIALLRDPHGWLPIEAYPLPPRGV